MYQAKTTMVKQRFLALFSIFYIWSINFALVTGKKFPSPAFFAKFGFSQTKRGESEKHNMQADDDIEEFHKYASAAVDLSNAHVSSSGILSMHRSVRDWDKDRRQTYLYQLNLKDDSEKLPPILMDESIKIRSPSPSGNRLLVIHIDENSQRVEFWQDTALVRRILIPSSRHGAIINDPTGFGIPSWSPDESCVVYAAERPSPKTKAFWAKMEDPMDSNVSIGGNSVLGQGAVEEWGEQYANQAPLLDLYVLHFGTGKVERISNVPIGKGDTSSSLDGITLGQPVWHPTLPKIAYTGWDAGGLGRMPRRLGMVYCRNRPSAIYVSDISNLLQRIASSDQDDKNISDSDYQCKTTDFPYARSPRYVNTMDGSSRLLFLANPNEFISHEGCMALYQLEDESDSKFDCIIPVRDVPNIDGPKLEGLGFPGLFLHQLPTDMSLNENYLILGTTWGSMNRIIRIHLLSKEVQLLELPSNNNTQNQPSSHFLLCKTPSGGLVLSETASNRPARLWLIPKSDLLKDAQEATINVDDAKVITEFPPMAASTYASVNLKQSTMAFDVQLLSLPTDDNSSTMQALFCLPHHLKDQKEKKIPLIVIPHGGPHSCTISSYSPGFAFLASHYAIVFPNYRGSTGFGQAALESLLTNIGDNDVRDIMATTQYVVDQFKDVVDKTKIGICGGSHGGFLTAHCTGQYPEYFKAAVMRNPVTNIASMVTATDIPDWCHAESIGSYDFTKFRGPTAEQIEKMYQKSPILHVDKVKTPTLVALGMKDLRVPPSQGLEWYHTLRSSGTDTELLQYPEDNHALNRVATEADHWIHIKKWFDNYLI